MQKNRPWHVTAFSHLFLMANHFLTGKNMSTYKFNKITQNVLKILKNYFVCTDAMYEQSHGTLWQTDEINRICLIENL